MARTYYDISEMLKTNAEYMMLLGQRSNGKSYQVKKTVLEDFYFNETKFIYLRRWKADIKQKEVSTYFDDIPIAKYTNREYNSVRAMNGFIYLRKIEDGLIVEKREMGRYCALNEYERYKSQVFMNYKNIVYEEFITDSIYLNDEPKLLQQFVSTVARLDKIRVFLIGNTLTRVCPYFHEWCLENVLKQKQGTIEIYKYHMEDNVEVKIDVEYCANTNNKNTMFFGQAAKQIVTGEWDVKEVPKLPRQLYEYEKIYEVMVVYQAFKFVLELLIEPKEGGVIIFVYPYTSNRKIQRVITDEFSDKPYISSKLDIDKKPELLMLKALRMDKVCYSDNLTGSDFSKVIEKLKMC